MYSFISSSVAHRLCTLCVFCLRFAAVPSCGRSRRMWLPSTLFRRRAPASRMGQYRLPRLRDLYGPACLTFKSRTFRRRWRCARAARAGDCSEHRTSPYSCTPYTLRMPGYPPRHVFVYAACWHVSYLRDARPAAPPRADEKAMADEKREDAAKWRRGAPRMW